MASSEKIALIKGAEEHGSRPAITSSEGTHTYSQLLKRSRQIGLTLLDGKDDLKEERVAFLTPRGFDYAALQWGIWRAGTDHWLQECNSFLAPATNVPIGV